MKIGIIGFIIFCLMISALSILSYRELDREKAEEALKGAIVQRIVITSTTTPSGSYQGSSISDPAILGTSTEACMEDPIVKDIQIGDDVDQIDLSIYFQASTTDASLNWRYAFSNDGTNWYGEDILSESSGTYTHQAATSTHTWTPATTEGLYKYVPVNESQYSWRNMNARWFRITFYKTSNQAGGKIFAKAILKSDY